MKSCPRVFLVAEVEDEREMYFTGLMAEGFAAICCGTDSDVTTAVRFVTPAVVVLVLARGGDESWNWARALHDHPGTRHIPVIIVSAVVHADGANRRIARQLGNCAAFVAKPCDHHKLAATIRRVIGGERHIEEVDQQSSFA